MKNKLFIAIVLILGFLLFDALVLDVCIDGNDKSAEIIQSLEENCQCDSITKNSSSVGLSMSKEDGFILGNTYSFTLENCMFDDIKKINQLVSNNSEIFNDIEFIELVLKANSEEESIIKIKNGSIL